MTTTPPLSVSPAAVQSFAGHEATTATRLGMHTAATDLTPLALTFGLIGSDFLAALGQVIDVRRTRLRRIAETHLAISAQSSAAASGYTSTDDTAGAVLTGAVPGPTMPTRTMPAPTMPAADMTAADMTGVRL
ncbi:MULTISPECIES: type VII secretion target [Gordonia]|uniref:type VII secretion target n=1 Tax=Gordonia TaxID=2053 RepID=UPI0032B6107C